MSYLWRENSVVTGEIGEQTSMVDLGARLKRVSAMDALSGMLTLADLDELIATGEVDTVIVAFADMQGRLTGKRVSARLFVEEVAEHGAECCNYLLAVDVDMNTVDGYAMIELGHRLRRHGDDTGLLDAAAASRGCPARRW